MQDIDDKLATPDTVFRNDDTEELPKNAEFGAEKFKKCDEFLQIGAEKQALLGRKSGVGLFISSFFGYQK